MPSAVEEPTLEWLADSVLLRRLDKLATDLTTPRDPPTREVNLVAASAHAPVNYFLQPDRSVTHYDRFSLFLHRFTNEAREAFNQPLLTMTALIESPRVCSPKVPT